MTRTTMTLAECPLSPQATAEIICKMKCLPSDGALRVLEIRKGVLHWLTFVMFRLIPGIFGHAKIMLRYFKTSNIISNVIECNFMYSLFNIPNNHTASVISNTRSLEFSLYIASLALKYQLCVHSARMGALQWEDWQGCTLNPSLQNGTDWQC